MTHTSASTSRLFLLAFLICVPATIGAQNVYTVWNTNDDGVGSLRQAILDANATGSGLIEFDIDNPGNDPLVIAPKSGLPEITQPGLVIDGLTQANAACNDLINGFEHKLFIVLDGSGLSGFVHGLEVDAGAHDVTISGLVIHSFPRTGVYSEGARTHVECSYIGTDVAGMNDRGNAWRGLELMGAQSRVAVSLVSGNGRDGIRFGRPHSTLLTSFVGTDVQGTAAIPNDFAGVLVQGDSVVIGGTSLSRNVISGNTGQGVVIDAGLEGCDIHSNYIGTDRKADGSVPNLAGITLLSGCDIGKQGANVISGNVNKGIDMDAGAVGSEVESNYIGTDITGTRDVGNGEQGISAADSTLIHHNVVAGNGGHGILLFGNGCRVWSNRVGIHATAAVAIPNDRDGIHVNASGQGARIGVDGINTISGNRGAGIYLWRTRDVVIMNNYIGVGGSTAGAVPNGESGIVDFADSTIIRFNQIGGNGGHGIEIAGPGKTVVETNMIGSDLTGILDFGNDGDGIRADSAGIIGPFSSGLGNVIAYNAGSGIAFEEGNFPIIGNRIFANGTLGIDLNDDGVTYNDPGDVDTGPNDFQNTPIIKPITYTGPGNIDVIFQMSSSSADSFYVEFFIADPPDPSLFGEGNDLVGMTRVATDGVGFSQDTVSFTTLELPLGTWVTATATRIEPSGDYGPTSEFSKAVDVAERVTLKSYLLLEGAYAGGGLMNGHAHFLDNRPAAHPYTDDLFNGTLLEVDTPVDVGTLSGDVLDWIVLSLRSGTDLVSQIARRVGLVTTWQAVTDEFEDDDVAFEGVTAGSYYVVACHRNHLCAMSDTLVDFSTGRAEHDFTFGNAYTLGPPAQKNLGDGYFGLLAGEAVPDGFVQALDFNAYTEQTSAGAEGYQSADFNMDGFVQALDFNLYIANTVDGATSQVP